MIFEQIIVNDFVIDICEAIVGYDEDDDFYYLSNYYAKVTLDGYEVNWRDFYFDYQEQFEFALADTECEHQAYLKDIYHGYKS